MKFLHKLNKISRKNNSILCIGLDSDSKLLPRSVLKMENSQFEFNKAIIDQTCDLVCAYKPNSAFYEGEGFSGLQALYDTIDYLKNNYPQIPIILDAKRADIANTNEGYLRSAFDFLGADAITLHPYLGKEAILPFIEQKNKGIFILCKTSNPGSDEFQNLNCGGKPLYEWVAHRVANDWNAYNNCMLVVGATYPEELKRVRKIAQDMTILVPGIGSQGGDLEATLRNGLNSQKSGLIINSSRGIIFSDPSEKFAESARKAAKKLKNQINQILADI
jgi:orotidine-5'-phosphate decarboxylase